MTKLHWKGGIDGTIVLGEDPRIAADNLHSLMEIVHRQSFSSTELNMLGHVLFFFALRDAFDNDPLLPAANKALDGAYSSLKRLPDSQSLNEGIDSMRVHVFPSRHLTSHEIVEKCFEIVSEKLPKGT